eukprot:6495048-Prymnesium_polylepis.1
MDRIAASRCRTGMHSGRAVHRKRWIRAGAEPTAGLGVRGLECEGWSARVGVGAAPYPVADEPVVGLDRVAVRRVERGDAPT